MKPIWRSKFVHQIVLSIQSYGYLSYEAYLKIKMCTPNSPFPTVVLLLNLWSLFEDQNLYKKRVLSILSYALKCWGDWCLDCLHNTSSHASCVGRPHCCTWSSCNHTSDKHCCQTLVRWQYTLYGSMESKNACHSQLTEQQATCKGLLSKQHRSCMTQELISTWTLQEGLHHWWWESYSTLLFQTVR